MRIGELAERTGASPKAIRYYERIGLIVPARQRNGYRSFDEEHVRAVAEIRELAGVGIPPHAAAPFVECLELGHEHGDDCVSSLAVYRDTIAELTRMIDALAGRRDALQRRLDAGAERTFAHGEHGTRKPGIGEPGAGNTAGEPVTDYTILPDGLPVPHDDGAADHLTGMRMPELILPTSDGGSISTAELGDGRTVIYLYPLTGRPGVDLPDGWDAIPGARGCSTEACDFRDHFAQLRDAGAARVYGMSSQGPGYQAEVVERLRLPFVMISDAGLALADALRLPTFSAPGHDRLYSRLTLIIDGGTIEHVFYPIFPPNAHAGQVLDWLARNPARGHRRWENR